MAAVVSLLGIVLAPVAAGVVYADASRRELSPPIRRLWAGSVGFATVVGFFLPALFEGALHEFYFGVVKSGPVVHTPYELLVLDVSVGLAAGLLAIALYLFGSRTVADGRGVGA
ncbi:hypothetical protein ACFQDG_12290 [Natronoarchaeum mannanilyticum]|uniref:Multicomponent Na+:H+ antiporter subunit B n=1 Tax=Natronoarchaeum mannanilyticum TaxID=926360 RepID=A0AAV3T8P5_9EURY